MKKILVVDDEKDILTIVELILTNYGFKVEAVDNWQDIPGKIKSFQPDLILLDVSLSGSDGREICIDLKNKKETGHIPVILFSANEKFFENLGTCKPDAVIAKPFDVNDLVQTIAVHAN